jgi:hypothetical protein
MIKLERPDNCPAAPENPDFPMWEAVNESPVQGAFRADFIDIADGRFAFMGRPKRSDRLCPLASASSNSDRLAKKDENGEMVGIEGPGMALRIHALMHCAKAEALPLSVSGGCKYQSVL